MTKQNIELVANIWLRLTAKPFSPEQLVAQARHDGGHDISNLTDPQILQLINGRFSGDWHEPAFSFSEMLAYYSVLGTELRREQIAAWVFAVFVLADAMDQKAIEMEMLFNNFLRGFALMRPHLEDDECIEIFRRFFAQPGTTKI